MNTKIIRDKEKEKVFLVKFYTKQKLVREVKAKTFEKAADIIKTIFGEVCFDYVDVVETAFTFAIKTLLHSASARQSNSGIRRLPEHKNEVSGLMIMGLFGGSIFSILAGLASDGIGSQIGALIVFCLGLAYLLYLSTQLNKQ